jgi:deoxyinosine 3'endonuclease (endonuclease V)
MIDGEVSCGIDFPKWVPLEEARYIQNTLSRKVSNRSELPRVVRYVAGLDSAYDETRVFSAAAVVDLHGMRLVEVSRTTEDCTFPYLPPGSWLSERSSLYSWLQSS